jgi:Sortase domain
MHLSGTGFPYERGSNTYIAGHAEGYNTTRVPHVFRNLEDLRQGNHIILRDATGRNYDYRVYLTASTSASSPPTTSGSPSLSPAGRSSRYKPASPPPPSRTAS